jgi:hypothetical protein
MHDKSNGGNQIMIQHKSTPKLKKNAMNPLTTIERLGIGGTGASDAPKTPRGHIYSANCQCKKTIIKWSGIVRSEM